MKELINPKGVYSSSRAYSRGVKFDIGDSEILFISGQISKNEKGEIVGKNDLAEQTDYIFKRIITILSEVNMDLKDIVKLTIYTTDMKRFEEISKVRNSYLKDSRPATTSVEIASTVTEGCEVEIDAIAIRKK